MAVVLAFEVLEPSQNPAERVAWYSVLIIVVTSLLTRMCRAQTGFDLFEPLHMTFALFLIFYPTRALFAVWLDESWFDPAKASVWNGLSASALGYICLAIGYKIVGRRSDRHRKVWVDRSWNLKRAKVLSLVFLIIGTAGFVAMRVLGGSFLYFILVDPDIKSPGEIKAWFFYLLWVCLLIQVGALIQIGIWLATRRGTLWTVTYSIFALMSTFLLARYFTVLFLMMLLLTSHYLWKTIKTIQVAILLLLLLGYLGIAGLYREWISPGYNLDETGALIELAGQQNKLVIRYVISNLEQLSNLTVTIDMTPSQLPYQFGSTFAPIVLKPIPRVLMPTKPLGASALFSEAVMPAGYENGLVTGLGAWGEWYLNFSWLGLTLGMAAMGALVGAAYKAARASPGFGRMILYLSSIVVLFTWLRNDFNSAITYGLYYFIPALAALMYVTRAARPVYQITQS